MGCCWKARLQHPKVLEAIDMTVKLNALRKVADAADSKVFVAEISGLASFAGGWTAWTCAGLETTLLEE